MIQTPQFPNGSPLLLSKSVLSRDSILKRLQMGGKETSDEKVKVSQIYLQLERRIQTCHEKHESQLRVLQEKISQVDGHIAEKKQDVHDGKVQLWELKNQIIYLSELLQREHTQFQQNFPDDSEFQQCSQMENRLEKQYLDQEEQEDEQEQDKNYEQIQRINTLTDIFSKWEQEPSISS